MPREPISADPDVSITVERRARSWWVLYAGTVLFIGSKREALAVAQACAKEWQVEIEEA